MLFLYCRLKKKVVPFPLLYSLYRMFFFFQAFEQQSAAPHSRHAVWQHAQPPSAVSTLFNTYQSSNSCQHVYSIIDPLNLVFLPVVQMTDGSSDISLFLSAGGAKVFCFGFVENTIACFYKYNVCSVLTFRHRASCI